MKRFVSSVKLMIVGSLFFLMSWDAAPCVAADASAEQLYATLSKLPT